MGAANDEVDEAEYQHVMRNINQPSQGEDNSGLVFNLWNRDIDTSGKADDAIDYEDIEDDDDLPEEESREATALRSRTKQDASATTATATATATTTATTTASTATTAPASGGGENTQETVAKTENPSWSTQNEHDDIDGLFGDADEVKGPDQVKEEGNDLDDLFGDAPSSPSATGTVAEQGPESSFDNRHHTSPPTSLGPPTTDDSTRRTDDAYSQPNGQKEAAPEDGMDPVTFREWQLQQALFAMSTNGTVSAPAPPENHEELLAMLWPKFRRDETPFFLHLLPPKKFHYPGKQPLKTPKKVLPTKLRLETLADQERSFKANGPLAKRNFETEQSSVVHIRPESDSEDQLEPLGELEDDADEDVPGGLSMQDLRTLCAVWDTLDPPSPLTEEEEGEEAGANRSLSPAVDADKDIIMHDNHDLSLEEKLTTPLKKRKTAKTPQEILSTMQIDIPYLDDPLEATELVARKIKIDMNDPYLLLDHLTDQNALNQARRSYRNADGVPPSKRLINRYNISNDDAYAMLKENHQNRIRSTLSNITVEHSLPAIKLQWPYYKMKLLRQEARSFHRPALTFFPNLPIHFKKPNFVKRKHQRGKDVKALYDSTKSLSLADNSHVLLVEYSEEYPMMMSNFGMGNCVVNYYRRKNSEDMSRPKAHIGETAVLMPQDKSPFSIFGHVESGETISAIVNGMFRAPIFQQKASPTDFLVIRNSTGVDGSHYYLRIIDNLFVAGQQYPSVDVPGPHSRKVTTASKNRLKMIAFRKIKRSPQHRVNVSDITEHFPDSNDMQNRQKMKEFLKFNKDYKEWEMKPGEQVPEEEALRGYVKPEDVCLLESMQVGQQHLQDSGYDKEEEYADDDEGKEGDSLEQQMAPWKLTRNYLQAAQGKAMLQLHGEGDPTGRGEGLSFIKTSMKGGFKAVGESVEDKLDAQRLKELGGHSYNVARQQKSYEDAIRRIWELQKNHLSSTEEYDDEDMDLDDHEQEHDADESVDLSDRRFKYDRPTPSLPGGLGPRDDETGSMFSRLSTSSQSTKIMRITRKVRNARGQIEEVVELVKDQRVIKQYQRLRHEAELRSLALGDIKPTGDPETDARRVKHLQEELQRLQRNKERRHAREKQKSISHDVFGMSPPAAGGGGGGGGGGPPGKGGATQRKCANCGQVGHIKTNKKLCPLLNGTMGTNGIPNASSGTPPTGTPAPEP